MVAQKCSSSFVDVVGQDSLRGLVPEAQLIVIQDPTGLARLAHRPTFDTDFKHTLALANYNSNDVAQIWLEQFHGVMIMIYVYV